MCHDSGLFKRKEACYSSPVRYFSSIAAGSILFSGFITMQLWVSEKGYEVQGKDNGVYQVPQSLQWLIRDIGSHEISCIDRLPRLDRNNIIRLLPTYPLV